MDMFQREDNVARRTPLEKRHDNDDYNSPPEKNNNQQMMMCHLDAMRNGGASEEGVRRGGRQQGACDGAHPPINKNWWGVSATMMTKNTPQTNRR
jgi:hypothetical protein